MPIAAWHRLPGWSKERDAKMQAWFAVEVQPRLRDMQPADICRLAGVAGPHSISIKYGRKIPHPRLYRVLAMTAGVVYPEDFP
jgi:hypothetical protein